MSDELCTHPWDVLLDDLLIALDRSSATQAYRLVADHGHDPERPAILWAELVGGERVELTVRYERE